MSKYLRNNQVTRPYFQGVYSADEIPWKRASLSKQQKCFFIFNLDPSHKDGSHWVCIMLGPCQLPLYFDSYGFEPNDENFERFMGNHYSFNDKPLQHPTSTNCGQWCMFFIHFMSLNQPFENLLKIFSHSLLKNDYLLSHLVRKIFKIDVWPLDKEYLLQQLCKKSDADANESR